MSPAKFAYKAYDRAGKVVSGAVEAVSAADAQENLRKQGLFVSSIAPTADVSPADSRTTRTRAGFAGRGPRLRNVAGFVRQLSVLVSTGTPMVDAIAALEKGLPAGEWRSTVGSIRSRVEEGHALSSALQHYPRYFDSVALSLIAAGESGGKLEAMLKRLSALTRQQLKVRSSITGAMVYPSLLVCVCFSVLCTLLFFVLPRFEGLFETLDAPLPPTTRMLLDLSAFLRDYWWIVLAALVAGGVCVKLWLSSAAGIRAVHTAMVRAPQIGRVVRAFATARIARVLGVLVEGRVPLLDALKLTRESSGNLCYEDLIARAEDFVTRGESISAAFQDSPLVSRSLTEAIRSGERSGQIGPVLSEIAEFLDEDNEIILRSLSSIVEPMILIVLGVLIGFVAISMFMPLFDLATAAQTGGTGGGG